MAAMTSFWDWAGRVVMLVLAGMITLSIISAIAAIPSGSLPQNIRIERESWPVPAPRQEPFPPVPADGPEPRVAPEPNAGAAGRAVTVAPAPEEPVEAADWLEAITYALLALVGIAALATLLLWRSLIQWRRGADALESLAARRG